MRFFGLIAFAVGALAKDFAVKRTDSSAFVWALHTYDDLTVNLGDHVLIRTFTPYHDISVVPTADELDACDMSNMKYLLSPDLDVIINGTNTADEWGAQVYTYKADYPGTHYFVCATHDGGHCRAGQKFTLTVLEEAGESPVEHKVMAKDEPYWTTAVSYDDMTITLGDTVHFPSDSEGYHDVGILNPNTCPDFECCANMGQLDQAQHVSEILYTQEEYKTDADFAWTPEAAGEYMVACTVYGGVHCMFGQKFKLTVRAPCTPNGSPCSDGMSCECVDGSSRRLLFGSAASAANAKTCHCV